LKLIRLPKIRLKLLKKLYGNISALREKLDALINSSSPEKHKAIEKLLYDIGSKN
jgi:hypothetical protein